MIIRMNHQSAPRRPLVYLVDDEPMLLDLNEQILRDAGYDAQRFRAAEQALETYRAAAVPPDLIITDFAMHRMTGIDLVGACRQLHPKQRFILVSGTINADFVARAPHQPDAFLAKPYLADELAELVRRVTRTAE